MIVLGLVMWCNVHTQNTTFPYGLPRTFFNNKTFRMKHTILNITLMLILTLIQTNLFAQSKMKTDTVSVSGNCGQCKSRIEEASYIKGVKVAEWNKKTKVLTVTYNSEKTTLDQIELAIAKAGHDSKAHKSADKDYKKLPSCCAYRTGSCDHD